MSYFIAFKSKFQLVIFAFLLLFPGVSYADPALIMGVFPRRNFPITIKSFTPLAKYLSEQLGREVTLESTHDFPDFWAKLKTGRYDITHFNQYHYVKAHKKYNYQVILQNEEFGRKTIAGSLIVRRDSGIKSIKDLKGKKIVFGGGIDAMQSYIIPRHLLKQSGLKEGDYITEFAINPPNALMAPYYRQAAAAGAGNVVIDLPVVKEKIDTSQLQLLVVGEELPQLCWAITAKLPQDIKEKIISAFLALNSSSQGKEILKSAELDGIHPAKDADFDAHRAIIKEVLGEEY